MTREYSLLSKILGSIVLRNLIFKFVKKIHFIIEPSNLFVYRCNWDDIGCFPDQLVAFNYVERYKQVFNRIVGTAGAQDQAHSEKSAATIKKFRELYLESLKAAIYYGRTEVLEFLINTFPKSEINFTSIMEDDYIINKPESIQFLHEHADHWLREKGTEVMDLAAAHGSLEVVKFLNENRSEGCKNAVNNACMNGHLHIVEYLHKNRTEPFSIRIMDIVAEKGHLNVLKYLHENTTLECTTRAMDNAKSLEIVQFLHYNRTEGCSMHAMHKATCEGRLDVVRFLQENRTEGCEFKTLDRAALNNQFEIFRYLISSRRELACESNVMDNFVNNQVAIQWFKQNTTFQLTSKCYYKVKGLESIKWIHENTTFPIPSDLLNITSLWTSLDLPTVKYLYENGITTNIGIYNTSDPDIISFLHNTHSAKVFTKQSYLKAILFSQIPKLKYIYQNWPEYENEDFSNYNVFQPYDYPERLKLIQKYKI